MAAGAVKEATMKPTEECQTPRYHDMHLCKLLKKGLMEELDRRSSRPTVICSKCGARANEGRDLCQPRPL